MMNYVNNKTTFICKLLNNISIYRLVGIRTRGCKILGANGSYNKPLHNSVSVLTINNRSVYFIDI